MLMPRYFVLPHPSWSRTDPAYATSGGSDPEAHIISAPRNNKKSMIGAKKMAAAALAMNAFDAYNPIPTDTGATDMSSSPSVHHDCMPAATTATTPSSDFPVSVAQNQSSPLPQLSLPHNASHSPNNVNNAIDARAHRSSASSRSCDRSGDSDNDAQQAGEQDSDMQPQQDPSAQQQPSTARLDRPLHQGQYVLQHEYMYEPYQQRISGDAYHPASNMDQYYGYSPADSFNGMYSDAYASQQHQQYYHVQPYLMQPGMIYNQMHLSQTKPTHSDQTDSLSKSNSVFSASQQNGQSDAHATSKTLKENASQNVVLKELDSTSTNHLEYAFDPHEAAHAMVELSAQDVTHYPSSQSAVYPHEQDLSKNELRVQTTTDGDEHATTSQSLPMLDAANVHPQQPRPSKYAKQSNPTETKNISSPNHNLFQNNEVSSGLTSNQQESQPDFDQFSIHDLIDHDYNRLLLGESSSALEHDMDIHLHHLESDESRSEFTSESADTLQHNDVNTPVSQDKNGSTERPKVAPQPVNPLTIATTLPSIGKVGADAVAAAIAAAGIPEAVASISEATTTAAAAEKTAERMLESPESGSPKIITHILPTQTLSPTTPTAPIAPFSKAETSPASILPTPVSATLPSPNASSPPTLLSPIGKPRRERQKDHTPRPANSFIIYRREKHMEIMAQYKGTKTLNNNVISKIVATMWRQEPAEIKAEYAAKAEEEKRIHMLKYPDYKYRPRKHTNKMKVVSNPITTGSVFDEQSVDAKNASPGAELSVSYASNELNSSINQTTSVAGVEAHLSSASVSSASSKNESVSSKPRSQTQNGVSKKRTAKAPRKTADASNLRDVSAQLHYAAIPQSIVIPSHSMFIGADTLITPMAPGLGTNAAISLTGTPIAHQQWGHIVATGANGLTQYAHPQLIADCFGMGIFGDGTSVLNARTTGNIRSTPAGTDEFIIPSVYGTPAGFLSEFLFPTSMYAQPWAIRSPDTVETAAMNPASTLTPNTVPTSNLSSPSAAAKLSAEKASDPKSIDATV